MAARSPETIHVICRHADRCGGCSLLHLPYASQLESKESTLRHLLASTLHDNVRRQRGGLFLPQAVDAGPPIHFRQKVAFVFASPNGRRLALGHYARGSNQVVPVAGCPVHSARGNRIAFALRDALDAAGVRAAGPTLDGILRHVIVRTTADDREAVAMLVVTRNDRTLRAPVRAFLGSTDRPDGFFINVNARPGPFMLGDETRKIDGRSHIRETVGGIDFLVSPDAFFQTNVAAAAALQTHVLTSVEGSARVLDLYCGSGLFTLPLAKAGAVVMGIEENPRAIADAEANARLNRIPMDRVRLTAGRVEQAIGRAGRERWDAVILDPPRQGCSDLVLEAVFQNIRPQRVTYVSCNPEALAAELPGIRQCGYEVSDLKAVDMFPHTEHLEAIVSFVRN